MNIVKKYSLKIGDIITTDNFAYDMEVDPAIECLVYNINNQKVYLAHNSTQEHYVPDTPVDSYSYKENPILKEYKYLDYIYLDNTYVNIKKIGKLDIKTILNNNGFKYAKENNTINSRSTSEKK